MKHKFATRVDYPNTSPGGRMWAGHYYVCRRCGLEVGHPDHLTSENKKCPGVVTK